MADENKIADAEAAGAKLSWGNIASEKMRSITNDIRTDVVESTKEGLHNGLNDIRHRLVEEAWFGEQVTDDVNYTKQETTEKTTNEPVTRESLYGQNINHASQEKEAEQEL